MKAVDPAIARAFADPAFTDMKAAEVGHILWDAIHTVTRGLKPTPERQEALKQFMQALDVLLPCDKCSQHFQPLVDILPTTSAPLAFQWSVDAHNEVNRRLGKKVLTYEEAIEAVKRNLQPTAPTSALIPSSSSGLHVTPVVENRPAVAQVHGGPHDRQGTAILAVVVCILAGVAIAGCLGAWFVVNRPATHPRPSYLFQAIQSTALVCSLGGLVTAAVIATKSTTC